jgi:hypothetical protein
MTLFFGTAVSFQVLTITKTSSEVIGDVKELQLLCLDGHKRMLEALEKMFQFYKNRHIDMFKDGISVPGLTLKYMFQDLSDYFTLPDEKNKDLYDLYKNNKNPFCSVHV